jgi:hypothetical protein
MESQIAPESADVESAKNTCMRSIIIILEFQIVDPFNSPLEDLYVHCSIIRARI